MKEIKGANGEVLATIYDPIDMPPCRKCGVQPVEKGNHQSQRLECPVCGIRTRQRASGPDYQTWMDVMGGGEMSGIELKPCPFCGGENLRIVGGVGKYVKCRDCEASSGHVLGGACNADERHAAEAWNRRQPLECEEYCPLNIGRLS